MSDGPPAAVGAPLSEIDTPSLLIHLDAFERNLDRLAADVCDAPVALRPHAKAHKCPDVARAQMDRGAVGLCCAKVGEAEAMVDGGVADVLVTNEVVSRPKLDRLAALAKQARIGVCVDSPETVAPLSAAATGAGAEIRVLVEVDVGQNRCGVEPGEAAVPLARAIDEAPGLRFGGLQAYHGAAQHIREYAGREEAIAGTVAGVERALEALERAGFACETVTGAGTGTYPFEMASGVYTELQAGSYIFMDVDYCRNLGRDGDADRRFEQSLSVLATVISRPAPERAVVDVGYKGVAVDSGLPMVRGHADWDFQKAGDEHGKIILPAPDAAPAIGEKILLIPGHCDPTVNLYDWFIGIRRGRVECLWPITGRGPGR